MLEENQPISVLEIVKSLKRCRAHMVENFVSKLKSKLVRAHQTLKVHGDLVNFRRSSTKLPPMVIIQYESEGVAET